MADACNPSTVTKPFAWGCARLVSLHSLLVWGTWPTGRLAVWGSIRLFQTTAGFLESNAGRRDRSNGLAGEKPFFWPADQSGTDGIQHHGFPFPRGALRGAEFEVVESFLPSPRTRDSAHPSGAFWIGLQTSHDGLLRLDPLAQHDGVRRHRRHQMQVAGHDHESAGEPSLARGAVEKECCRPFVGFPCGQNPFEVLDASGDEEPDRAGRIGPDPVKPTQSPRRGIGRTGHGGSMSRNGAAVDGRWGGRAST
jgi:hypothetical protein